MVSSIYSHCERGISGFIFAMEFVFHLAPEPRNLVVIICAHPLCIPPDSHQCGYFLHLWTKNDVKNTTEMSTQQCYLLIRETLLTLWIV